MRLLIVRHGESTANRDRLVVGQSLDVPLTQRGRDQADQAAESVADLVGDVTVKIFSSDAVRAVETARVIADRVGGRVVETPLLREQYRGDLEGRPASQMRALPVPEGMHISEIGWGGGESVAEVHQRMRRLLDWLKPQLDGDEVVVLVGHGDALCILQALLAGRGHREVEWDRDVLRNAEVREIGHAMNLISTDH